MDALRLLRVPAYTLLVALAVTLAEVIIVRHESGWLRPGTAASVVEWVWEVVAIVALLRTGREVRPARWLAIGVAFNLFGDVSYWATQYAPGKAMALDAPLVILSTACMYALAFAFIATAMMVAWERPLLQHFRTWSGILVTLGSTTLLAAAIAYPMVSELLSELLKGEKVHDFSAGSHLYYHLGQTATVLCGWLLLTASGISFLSTSSSFWSLLSAGSTTLVLADWAMRVEQFLAVPIGQEQHTKFGYYEVFWMGSVVAIGFTCRGHVVDAGIPRFDGSRLVSGLKLAVMAALGLTVAASGVAPLVAPQQALVVVGADVSLRYSEALRVILVGVSLSIFVTGALSIFLSETFKKFAESLDKPDAVASEFSGELREWFAQFAAARNERIRADQAERVSYTKRQLAHDMQAPVSALGMLIFNEGAAKLIERNLQTARNAVQRIADMAKAMLREGLEGSRLEPEVLSTIVETIVSEKRIEWRTLPRVNLESDVAALDACAVISSSQMYRVLSNLIDNSGKAVGEEGRISVELKNGGSNVQIVIHDDGCGIPPEDMEGIRRGMTTRTDGHGIGLRTAIETVEGWHGSLDIQSDGVGRGAKVSINLPKCEPPSWFAPRLNIPRGAQVVVADDDEAIRSTWASYLKASGPRDVNVSEVSSLSELEEWHASHPEGDRFLLVDYDFGGEVTGLDMVRQLRARDYAVIVTSHFQDRKLRDDCAQCGVRMIPKTSLGNIPISWS